MNANEMIMETPVPATVPAGRMHVPDRTFIEQEFPEPVMPAIPINRVLKGQKAIVTGGSSGIGRGVATALGQAGADVLVNYTSRAEEAEKVADEIHRGGTRALTFKADVSKEDQVQAMFKRAREEFGAIDILINNAGLQKDAPFDQMTLAQWQLVLEVNLTGQFLCAREAVREFKRRGVRKEVSCCAGKIICISSVHEVIPWAGHVNYAASKGGVMLMMKSIAQEVAPYRIRVNSVAPGAIRTPINMQAWDTPGAYRELLKLIPYKRIGEPIEIGRAVVWLASDDSDFLFDINVRTTLLCCRAVIPQMLRQGHGKLVNLASRDALAGSAGYSAYSASKSAVLRLTESLAAELKNSNINVNCILPGTIDTPQNRKAIPNGDYSKWVEPEAVANVLLFLVSEASGAINGAALPVYGRG